MAESPLAQSAFKRQSIWRASIEKNMEVLKKLPASVQVMVLRHTPVVRQLTSLNCLPVELHCMRPDRHPVALLLVPALYKFMYRHFREAVVRLYAEAIVDYSIWYRSQRNRTVDFNRRCIERSLKSGVDFFVAKGDKQVIYLTGRLEDDEEEYHSWVDYLDEVYPSVVDEM